MGKVLDFTNRRDRAELALSAEDVVAAAGQLRDLALRLGEPEMARRLEVHRHDAAALRQRIGRRAAGQLVGQGEPPRAA